MKPEQTKTIELLKNNVCQVTFTKVNGEQRVMPCTLKAELLPEQAIKENTEPKTARKKSEDTLSVFVTDIKQWRSFKWENLISVEIVE